MVFLQKKWYNNGNYWKNNASDEVFLQTKNRLRELSYAYTNQQEVMAKKRSYRSCIYASSCHREKPKWNSNK